MTGSSIYLSLKVDDWVYLLNSPSCNRPGWYLVARVEEVEGERIRVKCLENHPKRVIWVNITDVGLVDWGREEDA